MIIICRLNVILAEKRKTRAWFTEAAHISFNGKYQELKTRQYQIVSFPISRFIGAIFLVLVLLVIYGCASHRTIVTEPPSTSLNNYAVLEVKDVRSNIDQEDALRAASAFPEMIVKRFVRYNGEHPNKKLFSEVTRTTNETNRVVVLDCILLSYEKGSRAKRYFFGFGAGKAYSSLQCEFVDKETNEQVLKANFEGELSMGFFGGSAKDSQHGVVQAIIDYVGDSLY